MREIVGLTLLAVGMFHWTHAETVSTVKRVISIDDFLNVKRIEDVALSPDGDWLAFGLVQIDSTADVFSSDIYLAGTRGTSIRHLTTHPSWDGRPCWSPDGSLLAFLSDRSGSRQIHLIPVAGGEAVQVSRFRGGVEDFVWSPDGRFFVFSAMGPDSNDHIFPVSKRAVKDSISAGPHDDQQIVKRVRSLYLMSDSGGQAVRLTPDTLAVSPGRHAFCFSPDGREIAFSAFSSMSQPPAVYVMFRSGHGIRRLTTQAFSEDMPVYSPDGRYLVFRSASWPGPGQKDIKVFSRKDHVLSILTGFFDLDVNEMIWNRDSERLYFTASDQGREVLFSAEARSRKIRGLAYTGFISECQADREQDRLFFMQTRANQPAELYVADENGEDANPLTFFNPTSKLAMNPMEEFWFPSFDGKMVHAFFLKPPFFDPSRKYPLILAIHDGPHDASKDEFEFAWNPQMLASRGAVVLEVNYRGSTGFGQEFAEASQRDWGGAPYKDLMTGLEYAISKFSFIDSERMAACGSFFGGFLTHWIAGHSDRFKCLMSQSGITDPFSFYYETDETSWLEWEFGGAPYDDEKAYEKWAPLRFAKEFATPMLLIQCGMDLRNPQGALKMDAALRRLNVPVRMIDFKNENRSIEHPVHLRALWRSIFEWIDRWLGEKNPS